jgi:hypothetical protein
MSVSDTRNLSTLDRILYDRPAGRNIIDHAIETIIELRKELDAAHQELNMFQAVRE